MGLRQKIADRLADPNCRLLTILGPGGSGKTRLALKAAANFGARTGLPVHYVPLAAAHEPGMMAAAHYASRAWQVHAADPHTRHASRRPRGSRTVYWRSSAICAYV